MFGFTENGEWQETNIMKKRFLAVCMAAVLAMAIGLCACGGEGSSASSTSKESSGATGTALSGGVAYGYAGSDPVTIAVYKYMVEEVGKEYDKSDASIPTVVIFYKDESNPDDVVIYGDFWIENYSIKDKTLTCESGGNYPGVMHVRKDGDKYVVSNFDVVADGADFEKSAKELFGDHYDTFVQNHSDENVRDAIRRQTISDYVTLNNLKVTKYQDKGGEPVGL